MAAGEEDPSATSGESKLEVPTDGRQRRAGLKSLLGEFRDRPLELAGVFLTLGSFVALLVLIAISFVPDTPELALIKGFQSLLTMASIGIIAVIASRQTEQLITALAIVIVAVVFVSIDDLVRLYVTVSGSDRDLTTVLSGRSTNSAEVGSGKRDFRNTAQRIRQLVEARVGTHQLSDNGLRILQEDIRKLIVEAEHAAILQRISDKGADELLGEIYDEEFVVSYLKYEGLPQFQFDIQLLRFEGLIDDRYGDLPDTVEVTELGCLILARLRNQDLECRPPEVPEIAPEEISPIDEIHVDDRRVVAIRGQPAVLSLALEVERRLQIDAVPTSQGDLDPYLEIYEEKSGGGRELLAADDDGGGGLNARITRAMPAGNYLLSVTDFFGDTGEISVSVTRAQEPASRQRARLDEDSTPIPMELFVGGDAGGTGVALEIIGPARPVRIEARSQWLDTMIDVYRIDRPDAPVRDLDFLAGNDDRSTDSLDACVEVEMEPGWYAVQVSDFDGLTGEVTTVFSNSSPALDEPCDQSSPGTAAR